MIILIHKAVLGRIDMLVTKIENDDPTIAMKVEHVWERTGLYFHWLYAKGTGKRSERKIH